MRTIIFLFIPFQQSNSPSGLHIMCFLFNIARFYTYRLCDLCANCHNTRQDFQRGSKLIEVYVGIFTFSLWVEFSAIVQVKVKFLLISQLLVSVLDFGPQSEIENWPILPPSRPTFKSCFAGLFFFWGNTSKKPRSVISHLKNKIHSNNFISLQVLKTQFSKMADPGIIERVIQNQFIS